MKYIEEMIKNVRDFMVGYHSLPDQYKDRVVFVRMNIQLFKADSLASEKIMLSLPEDTKLIYVETNPLDLSLKYYVASKEFPKTSEGSIIPEVAVWTRNEEGPFSTDNHKAWKVR